MNVCSHVHEEHANTVVLKCSIASGASHSRSGFAAVVVITQTGRSLSGYVAAVHSGELLNEGGGLRRGNARRKPPSFALLR
jgi:hypothetical protein